MGFLSAKVTSKGQITLPSKLRSELGIKTGDHVDFHRNAAGKIEMTAKTRSITDLRGIIMGDRKLSSQDFVDIVDNARSARALDIAARLRAPQK